MKTVMSQYTIQTVDVGSGALSLTFKRSRLYDWKDPFCAIAAVFPYTPQYIYILSRCTSCGDKRPSPTSVANLVPLFL